MPEIIARLELTSDRWNKQERQWQKEREEERIEAELEEQKEKELNDFITLFGKAERWHKAQNLRNYIREAEAREVQTAEWISWARLKADWYDPFIEAEDELLAEINRDKLLE